VTFALTALYPPGELRDRAAQVLREEAREVRCPARLVRTPRKVSQMPVEFISATHTTPTTEATAGGRRSGFDVDYTRRFVHAPDDGGFDWTLVAYGLLRRPATPGN